MQKFSPSRQQHSGLCRHEASQTNAVTDIKQPWPLQHGETKKLLFAWKVIFHLLFSKELPGSTILTITRQYMATALQFCEQYVRCLAMITGKNPLWSEFNLWMGKCTHPSAKTDPKDASFLVFQYSRTGAAQSGQALAFASVQAAATRSEAVPRVL